MFGSRHMFLIIIHHLSISWQALDFYDFQLILISFSFHFHLPPIKPRNMINFYLMNATSRCVCQSSAAVDFYSFFRRFSSRESLSFPYIFSLKRWSARLFSFRIFTSFCLHWINVCLDDFSPALFIAEGQDISFCCPTTTQHRNHEVFSSVVWIKYSSLSVVWGFYLFPHFTWELISDNILSIWIIE